MAGAAAVFLPLQTATSIRSWITALRVNTGQKRARTDAAPTATAKSADDIVLRMPVGTVITNADTGEVIADLAEHEQKVVLAKGEPAASATCISSPAPTGRPVNLPQASLGKNSPSDLSSKCWRM